MASLMMIATGRIVILSTCSSDEYDGRSIYNWEKGRILLKRGAHVDEDPIWEGSKL